MFNTRCVAAGTGLIQLQKYAACLQQAEEAAAQEEAAPDPSLLSQEMLRKYITFAKQNCHPKLANADYEKISQVDMLLGASAICALLTRMSDLYPTQQRAVNDSPSAKSSRRTCKCTKYMLTCLYILHIGNAAGAKWVLGTVVPSQLLPCRCMQSCAGSQLLAMACPLL